jgi:hypothetical protein
MNHHKITCEHWDSNWPHAALALDFTDFGTRFFDLFSTTAPLDFSPLAVTSSKIKTTIEHKQNNTNLFSKKNRIETRSHLKTPLPRLESPLQT